MDRDCQVETNQPLVPALSLVGVFRRATPGVGPGHLTSVSNQGRVVRRGNLRAGRASARVPVSPLVPQDRGQRPGCAVETSRANPLPDPHRGTRRGPHTPGGTTGNRLLASRRGLAWHPNRRLRQGNSRWSQAQVARARTSGGRETPGGGRSQVLCQINGDASSSRAECRPEADSLSLREPGD